MNFKNVPQHIAIIMDGNGRWAKKRGLPRIAGHREGASSLKAVLRACQKAGVKYLTVYAFSTENWRRPKEEVGFLMNLLSESIDREIKELHENGIRFLVLGRLSELNKNLQDKIKEAMDLTAKNKKGTLCIMLNYGARAEITDAVNSLLREGIKEVDEKKISERLYTKGIPDPDLLVRTAAEMRISNFLLWQIAYTELYITPTLWPDFKEEALIAAIEEYKSRERKFGMTSEQLK